MIFAQRIAPELNITARYVGEEPNDKTTMAYNQAMSEILPGNGIELYIIPRKEINGEVVLPWLWEANCWLNSPCRPKQPEFLGN